MLATSESAPGLHVVGPSATDITCGGHRLTGPEIKRWAILQRPVGPPDADERPDLGHWAEASAVPVS